jgi:predicted metalloprotease
MATAIWNGTVRGNHDPDSGRVTGDFSVAYALAHEYAHNLQAEAGLFQRYPVYKTELHADCLAGIWANSAYFRDILDANDLDELAAIIERIGDYLSEDDPRHHGTPQQRYDAFMTGYNRGDPAACDSWLDADY